MYRLKLVVADNDEEYIKGFCGFINEEHRNNVSVVSFTRTDSLKKYLLSGEKIDVLLIGPGFTGSEAAGANAGISVILSGSEIERHEEFPSVNRYQNGDRLLGQLIDLFAEKNKGIENLFETGGRTRIVAVYSPCGGAGKSTVAVNLAVQASLMGSSVFYLNLEPFSSSLHMLSGQGQKCLSNILLHVREEESHLPARIRSARVRDMKYNVDFFIPPESGAELSDLGRECTANLLMSIRRVGIYDLIVVDTDSALNEKNMAVLENSDGIILLTTQDSLCLHKSRLMRGEMDKAGLNIDHKIITVINRFREDAGVCCDGLADVKLPLVEDVVLKNGRSGFMEFNSCYAGQILRLAKIVLGSNSL